MGYPFQIFQLCKKARVEFTWHEEQLQPTKSIHVKIKYWGSDVNAPRIYDSRNQFDEFPN